MHQPGHDDRMSQRPWVFRRRKRFLRSATCHSGKRSSRPSPAKATETETNTPASMRKSAAPPSSFVFFAEEFQRPFHPPIP